MLADDFVPVTTGAVVSITWWGSAPVTAGEPDQWEVTFHTDAGGVPAATAPSGGISQHFVTAGGIDLDGDGVWEYNATWTPQDVTIVAGTTYWFSVANFELGWTWAYAGTPMPTVGSEAFTPVVSTGVGPNGGPHFGPWNALDDDFAFRINIPGPATCVLFGAGLLACVRRRTR